MDEVLIGSCSLNGQLGLRIGHAMSDLRVRGVQAYCSEFEQGGIHFVKCALVDPGKNMRPLFLAAIAHSVADLILIDMQPVLMSTALGSACIGLEDMDADAVLIYAAGFMGEIGRATTDRRLKIAEKVKDHLRQWDTLNIDGFIKFRMRDYLRDVKTSIGLAVEQCIADREQREFIRLLRHFVDMQWETQTTVHIVRSPGASIRIIDNEGRPVDGAYLEEFSAELSGGDLNMEDVLISALITASPKRLVVHVSPADPFISTVKGVFGDRVEGCPGCDMPGCVGSLLTLADARGYNGTNLGQKALAKSDEEDD